MPDAMLVSTGGFLILHTPEEPTLDPTSSSIASPLTTMNHLISPILRVTDNWKCMKIWYFAAGEGNIQLTAFQTTFPPNSTSVSWVIIPSVVPKMAFWNYVQIPLRAVRDSQVTPCNAGSGGGGYVLNLASSRVGHHPSLSIQKPRLRACC